MIKKFYYWLNNSPIWYEVYCSVTISYTLSTDDEIPSQAETKLPENKSIRYLINLKDILSFHEIPNSNSVKISLTDARDIIAEISYEDLKSLLIKSV
jgi:hypothetical protein